MKPGPKRRNGEESSLQRLRAVAGAAAVTDGAMADFPGAEYDAEQHEFIQAMGRYIRKTGRKFPMFTEVLAVAESLGWRRVAPVGPLPTFPLERNLLVPPNPEGPAA